MCWMKTWDTRVFWQDSRVRAALFLFSKFWNYFFRCGPIHRHICQLSRISRKMYEFGLILLFLKSCLKIKKNLLVFFAVDFVLLQEDDKYLPQQCRDVYYLSTRWLRRSVLISKTLTAQAVQTCHLGSSVRCLQWRPLNLGRSTFKRFKILHVGIPLLHTVEERGEVRFLHLVYVWCEHIAWWQSQH